MRRSAWYVLAAASFLLAWLSPSVYASFEGGSWRLEWFSLSNPGIALVTLVYAVAIAGIAVLAAKLRHGYRFGYGTSLVAAWTIGGMAATGIFVLTNHYLVSDLGHTPLWEYWLGGGPPLIMYALTSLLASLFGLRDTNSRRFTPLTRWRRSENSPVSPE